MQITGQFLETINPVLPHVIGHHFETLKEAFGNQETVHSFGNENHLFIFSRILFRVVVGSALYMELRLH